MRIYSEIITILAVTYLNIDEVSLVGINENGKWLRALKLNKDDLSIEGERVVKPFTKIKIYLLNEEEFERREDRIVFIDAKIKIELVNVLNVNEQKQLMEKYLDSSISEIFNSFRSIGIIKPIIDKIEFSWNSYSCNYQARFVFRDSRGDKYKFICNDPVWQRYWTDFIRRDQMNINTQLLKIQWKLNDENIYFVVGLTNKFNEIPGPFDGKWPIVLGVLAIKAQEEK